MDWHTPINRSKEFTTPVTAESCMALWRAVFARAFDDATTSMPEYNSTTHLFCKEVQAARDLFTKPLFKDHLEALCDLANIDFPPRKEVCMAIAEAAVGDGGRQKVDARHKVLAAA